MIKKRKIVIYVSSGIVVLAILAFLYNQVVNSQYKNSIPEYPGSTYPSAALEQQIQESIQKAHRKPSADNLGELGMIYHSSANYTEASQCYSLAISKSKSDWKWNYYLAHLNMELGKLDVVIENLNRVLELDPDVSLAWYYLGEAYGNLGEIDLAKKAFLNITAITNINASREATRIDHFPLSAYSMFQLSKIYIDNGQAELAEENLKKLIDLHESFGPAYRLLGNIYNMRGDITSGEELYVRADGLYLFSPPVDTLVDQLALLSRSELYLLKKIDEATQNYYFDWALRLTEHGLKYMPENKFLISKAIELYLRKDLEQKAAVFKVQHINSFKDNYAEMVKVGRLFFQKEMYKEAADYLAIAWTLRSENIEVLKSLAISIWNTGDKRKAVEILSKAAESNKDHPEKLAVIAYTFFRFGITENATFYLNRLKHLSPQNPKVQKLAGMMAESYGNSAAAISSYELAFKGDPEDTETINSLGDLYLDNAMWSKYVKFSKEVLKVHPNDPKYLDNLGSFLLAGPDEALINLDEGIYYSKRAFINISSGPVMRIATGRNLAIAYFMKGDKKNALRTIKKTMEIARQTNAPSDIQEDLLEIYRSIQE